MRRTVVWFSLLTACCLAGWLYCASWLFLTMGRLTDQVEDPWGTAWIVYATAPGLTLWAKIYLAISALLPGVVVISVLSVAVRFAYVRAVRRKLVRRSGLSRVERGVTDNHGHAVWMSDAEARALFAGPSSAYGGITVGEDSCGELLIDSCDRLGGSGHSQQIAGAGAFKTSSALVSAITWTGSSVILDPSCEWEPMIANHMRDEGKRAFALNLSRPEGAARWGLNVLDWIDINDPEASTHVDTVVGWIYGRTQQRAGPENPNSEVFRGGGKQLVACFLAHLLWSQNDTNPIPSLEVLRVMLTQPEGMVRAMLAGIHGDTGAPSPSLKARQIAATLMGLVPETFSGVYFNATEATSWLSTESYAKLVSGDGFKTSDLIGDTPTTVFIQIPLASMINTPAVCRTIVGALLNAVIRADGKGRQRKVLFLLDEAARLGRMDVLEAARDVGRKYGIVLHLLWQSVGQIDETWTRDGRKAWFDAMSWTGFSAIQNLDTAKEVSELCGTMGVMSYSEGDNSGRQSSWQTGRGSRSRGRQVNKHEIKRPIVLPAEVVCDIPLDEMIVLMRGQKPLRCKRAIWFRRPSIACHVEANRFAA